MNEEQAKELMMLLSSFAHCEKGLCMTPATRTASYYVERKKVAEMLSCDQHGDQPVFVLKEAELLRAGSDLLRAGGYPGWWEAYSGELNWAAIPLEFELVLVGLRAALGNALTPAGAWELYAKLLDERAEKYLDSHALEISPGVRTADGRVNATIDAIEQAAAAARDIAMKLQGR